jgi:hypothetical protein
MLLLILVSFNYAMSYQGLMLVECKIMDVEAAAPEVGTIWVGGRARVFGAGWGP